MKATDLTLKLEAKLVEYNGMIPYHRLTSIFKRDMNAKTAAAVVSFAVEAGIVRDVELIYKDTRRIRKYRFVCLPEWESDD